MYGERRANRPGPAEVSLRAPRGVLAEGGIMLGNVLTRRAALVGLGAFAAAGLSGCNTTPSAGVAAGGRLRAPAARSTSIRRRWSPMSAIRPRAGCSSLCRARLPRVSGQERRRAPRAYRHALSGQRRTGRSRPDERRRDGGRPDDQRARGLDLFSNPDRSGAAGTGAAGPRAGAVRRLRLSVEDESSAAEPRKRSASLVSACACEAALALAFLTVPRSRLVLTALAAASLRWACG